MQAIHHLQIADIQSPSPSALCIQRSLCGRPDIGMDTGSQSVSLCTIEFQRLVIPEDWRKLLKGLGTDVALLDLKLEPQILCVNSSTCGVKLCASSGWMAIAKPMQQHGINICCSSMGLDVASLSEARISPMLAARLTGGHCIDCAARQSEGCMLQML